MIQMLETIYFWDLQSITGKIDYNPLNNQFYWSVANAMFSSLKCFGAPRHQIVAKSAPQKARNCEADFPAVFFLLCHGTQMKIQVQILSWVGQSKRFSRG